MLVLQPCFIMNIAFLTGVSEPYRDTYKKTIRPIEDKKVYVINDVQWGENYKEVCQSNKTDNSLACPFFDKFLPLEPMSVTLIDELVQNKYTSRF